MSEQLSYPIIHFNYSAKATFGGGRCKAVFIVLGGTIKNAVVGGVFFGHTICLFLLHEYFITYKIELPYIHNYIIKFLNVKKNSSTKFHIKL